MSDLYLEIHEQQCTDCGHWRESVQDVFVGIPSEGRTLCGACYDQRSRRLRGEPEPEVDMASEEDGALEDMIQDYSDLPLFAGLAESDGQS